MARPWPGRIAEMFAAEGERWALWLPVLFAAGIAAYFALSEEPPAAPALGVAAAAAALVAALRRSWPGLALVALAVAVAAGGFSAAKLRTLAVAAPVLETRIGPASFEGRVEAVSPHGTGRRIVLADPAIQRVGRAATPARVRVTVRGEAPAIRPGDWIGGRAIFNPPPEPAAPGAFDFARHAFFARLGAVGFALGPVQVLDAAPADGAAVALERLRQRLYGRITEAVPGEAGAVAAALMIGERGRIPEDAMEAMRVAGLGHLLAISGLHLGLVTGLLFFAVRFALALNEGMALRRPIKKIAALAALGGALFYLLISGATLPTQRAFLMVAVVMVAVLTDRSAISMRLVAWAAAIILLLRPESLLSVSFQMSFAAVIALVAAYEAARGRIRALRRDSGALRLALLYLGGVVFSTVIAEAAIAPFAAFHFNRVPAYGLAANLLAIPLTAFWIMPCALAAFVLMPLGAEPLALLPMGLGIDALLAIARTVATAPGAVLLVPAVPVAALGLVASGGLWLCLWRTRWRLLGIGVAALGGALALVPRPPDVLISRDGALAAVRAEDGALVVSSLRTARFTRDVWLRRAGQGEALSWTRNGGAPGVRCDGLGCIVEAGERRIAFVAERAALAEDCRRAEIVVSRFWIAPWICPAPVVIDGRRLAAHGAHALWLADDIALRSVAEIRGARPWTRDGRRALNSAGRARPDGPGS